MSARFGNPAAEKGMTLIEVLISTMLLSFVVVASVSVLTLTLKQNKQAGLRSVSTSLAAERLERLMTSRFRGSADSAQYALAEETTAAGPPRTFSADYGEIPDYPEFRRELTLNYDVPQAGMIQAIVDVFWQDLHQGEKSHRLVTFLHPTLHTGL